MAARPGGSLIQGNMPVRFGSHDRPNPDKLSDDKPLVIVESPFAGKTPEEEQANIEYARMAVRDSLLRGEAPIASHLLYTQPGILDDAVPEERKLGIDAGLAWRAVAHKSVIYTDRGISRGMQYGIDAAKTAGKEVEFRSLYDKAQPNPVNLDRTA